MSDETGSGTGAPVEQNRRRGDLAFARVLARLRAQSEAELITLNFDVAPLIAPLLATAQRVKSRRVLLEQVQPFDIDEADRFEDYILALAHAHALVRIAEDTVVTEDVPYLMEQRRHMFKDAERAVERGWLDAAKLEKISMSSNASELAVDAMALAHIFLQQWDKLGGRTGVSREDLETILDRSNNVLLMLGAKDDQRASYQEATLDRRRAATKVFKTHRRIRIALALVLDEQKLVDEIAPQLAKRKRTKRKSESSPTNTVPEEDPLEDGLDDDTEDEDAVEPVAAEPAPAVRDSVLITKGNKQFKSAVGDGLPGSSPVDDGV